MIIKAYLILVLFSACIKIVQTYSFVSLANVQLNLYTITIVDKMFTRMLFANFINFISCKIVF